MFRESSSRQEMPSCPSTSTQNGTLFITLFGARCGHTDTHAILLSLHYCSLQYQVRTFFGIVCFYEDALRVEWLARRWNNRSLRHCPRSSAKLDTLRAVTSHPPLKA